MARADLFQAIIESNNDIGNQKIDSAKQNLAAMRETFPIIRSTFKGDISLVDQIETELNNAIGYRDKIFDLIADGKKVKPYK